MSSTAHPSPTRHWYVRMIDAASGRAMIGQLDEGERALAVESQAIGHALLQYSCYLLAIAMVWLGSPEVAHWSIALLLLPAISQTLSGLYTWVKHRQLAGYGRLPLRAHLRDGIPIFVLAVPWIAGLLWSDDAGTTLGKLAALVIATTIAVAVSALFLLAGVREQRRLERAEDDDLG